MMILTSIKSFIKTQKLLFTIFILLQILAVASAQYAYIGNTKIKNDWIIYVEDATCFTVEFKEPVRISQISSAVEKTKGDYGEKLAAISIDILHDNLRAYYFGQNRVVSYGSSADSVNDVIISTTQEISNGKKLGDIFETKLNAFTVVGIRTNVFYNEILIEAVDNSFEIGSVNIMLSFLPTFSQKNEFCKYLQKLFPDTSIIAPEERSGYTESYGSSQKLINTLLLTLSIINIVFIFKYVITKRKKTYHIARLCGASKRQIFVMTFTEYFIYCGFSCILASLITKLVIIPVFYENVYFTWDMIVYPAIVFFIVCIFVTIPLLLKNSNLNIIQNKAMK